MRALLCNDLHLKPAGSDYDVAAMTVPDDVDAVFVAGDLTHRAGEEDESLARRFVEHFAPDVPVLYVPGNHDNAPMPERVVEGLGHASSGHNTVHKCESTTVVGWGCECRSLDPPLDQTTFPALDPRTAPRDERRYAADRTADAIETALLDIVAGDATARDAADELGIASEHEEEFVRSVDTVRDIYDHLTGLIGDRSNVVVVSHLSPFNTSFDRHHSTGTREADREGLHTGSIALALVTRTHDVYATLTGHSHDFGYDTRGGPKDATHMLNLGFRGLGIVDINPDAGVFSFTNANPASATHR
jgi:Icc-related predicted phosphoesterase